MEFTQLGRTGLKVSRLCLGTMNFGPLTSEEDAFAIMDKATSLASTFSTRPTSMAGRPAKESRKTSSAAGSLKAEDDAGKPSSPPKSLAAWAIGQISRSSRHCISVKRARRHSNVCIPITLTFIKCITWIATRRGTKFGRQWKMPRGTRQGALRWLVELCGLAYCQSAGSRQGPSLHGTCQRTKSLQFE